VDSELDLEVLEVSELLRTVLIQTATKIMVKWKDQVFMIEKLITYLLLFYVLEK